MTTPTEERKEKLKAKREKNKRKLTKKEKGFVADYVETENGTQSVLKHYETEDTNVAAVIASENLSKPKIQEAIESSRQRIAKAIPDELIAEKTLALLNKRETIKVIDPDTKEIHLMQTDEIHVEGVKAGLAFIGNVKGVTTQEAPAPVTGNTYNFFYKPEMQKTTKEFEEKLKNLMYEDKKESNG